MEMRLIKKSEDGLARKSAKMGWREHLQQSVIRLQGSLMMGWR